MTSCFFSCSVGEWPPESRKSIQSPPREKVASGSKVGWSDSLLKMCTCWSIKGRSSRSSIRLKLLIHQTEQVQRRQGQDLGAVDNAVHLDVLMVVVGERAGRPELDQGRNSAFMDHEGRIRAAGRGLQVRLEAEDLGGPVASHLHERQTSSIVEVAGERHRRITAKRDQLPGPAVYERHLL